MSQPLTGPEILNREFLEMRCKILDLAAAFDRLGRAEGAADSDPRVSRLKEALTIVLEEPAGRAEQVQLHFSREYDDGWQQSLQVNSRHAGNGR